MRGVRPACGPHICPPYKGRSSRWWRCRLLTRLRQALLIERDKIDRIEQERGKTTVAHRGCNDLAREREQQPRALDQQQRLQVLLRHVLEPEHAREGEIEGEQHGAGILRLALELERHLVLALAELLNSDIDGDVNGRLVLARRQ